MAEVSEDLQKLKRIAAAAYDYENDPRWAEYWSDILIPPHMGSRSDVVDHFKRKFYQLYIDPDLLVEAMSSSTPLQSTTPSASSSTSSSAANNKARAHNAGATTRSSGASAASGSNITSVHWERQTIRLSVNAWVFIVAVLAFFPLVPRSLSNRAYWLLFMGTACSSLYSFRPKTWNLQAVQVYFKSIIATKDFIYFIYCLTFVTSHLCLKLSLIPILCWALEQVVKFLRHNFNRSTLYRLLIFTRRKLNLLDRILYKKGLNFGWTEIMWHRNIVQTFMYWQLLKLMYHALVTAVFDQSVWAKIGRTVSRLSSVTHNF